MIIRYLGVAWAIYVASAPVFCLGDDREELISYLELQESNWMAIKQMDVLCRTDMLREPALLPGMTETVFERIILDWETDDFTYVRTATKKSLGGQEKSETVETGFVISDGQFRSFQPSKRHLPAQRVDKNAIVFDEHLMPDLRLVMFMKLSHGSSKTWSDNRMNAFQTHPQLALSVKSTKSTDGLIGYEMLAANDAGRRWDFDLKSLMPVRTVWFLKPAQSPNELIVGKENITWSDNSGIFVPTSIQGEYRDRQYRMSPAKLEEEMKKLSPSELTPDGLAKFIEKASVDTSESRDMRLHWVTINKQSKKQNFDLALIDAPEKFIALTNPTTVGASELSDEFNAKR